MEYFSQFFGENIFKIITSVPGQLNMQTFVYNVNESWLSKDNVN
jgi:hypothetical protein